MHETPGSAFSAGMRYARRRAYSPSIFEIAAEAASGFVRAKSPAFCVMEQTFEVACETRRFIVSMRAWGPIAKPMRQPVIAYVFESVPATRIVSGYSRASEAAERCRPSKTKRS